MVRNLLPPKKVKARRLRRIFNRRLTQKRIKAAAVRLDRDGHPSPPLADEPLCTRSQMLGYYDRRTGRQVAKAHQYLRPDETIGLSGESDPKSVAGLFRRYYT